MPKAHKWAPSPSLSTRGSREEKNLERLPRGRGYWNKGIKTNSFVPGE